MLILIPHIYVLIDIATNQPLSTNHGRLNKSVSMDPFSKLCQIHTARSNRVKLIGDENSMQYILGLRSIAKDVFFEEVNDIAKAVYEEVVWRVGTDKQPSKSPMNI